MEKIMKKLTGLIIILAVLVLGGYYGMGVFTEKAIKKNITIINQSNGLVAEIQNYNRGWFHSDAVIKWRLHVPERAVTDADGKSQTVPAQDYQIEMPVVVYHGPLIYADHQMRFGMGYAETMLPLPEQYDKQFDDLFSKNSTKPQLDLSIFVNYIGKSDVELSLPAFKLIAKDGNGQFDWSGMETTMAVTSNMGEVNGKVVIDGMSINKDDTKITLGKVMTEFDLHQTVSGLYLGEANFTLPSFDIMVKDQKMFEVNDLSVNSSSDVEDNLFSTHFDLSLKSLLVNNETFGPGEVEISLRNLDADVLASINAQATAMQNGTEAQRQQAMMALLPELPKLFSKGAEFEISRLNMKLPQGVVDGSLLLTMPKGISSNPFELLQKIQGNAKLKMPIVIVKQLMQQSVTQQMTKQAADTQQVNAQQTPGSATTTPATTATTDPAAVAAQVDKQIASMEQSGLITVNGSDYVVEITLEQGKFTVNGKTFDPTMLKF